MNTTTHTDGGHNNHAHPDDPAKQSEHSALENLITSQSATHTAVKNGSWFNPNTWAGGRIPNANAKVVIPKGINVSYDNVSNTRLFSLRVDGHLDFATNADTKMVIDTFIVSPDGKLTIGTKDKPVQGNVQTEILIADNGAIDTKWDPEQLSRGIISHGTVSIHGQAKTSHLKVTIDPTAGDKTLTLEKAPTNWQVGDEIVLTGTQYVVEGTQDEQRTITAINGNRITLDKALTYNHQTPRSDLKAYVANQSRNIVFATENADKLPSNQRGHVMFMHSDNVDVRYVEFNELGRTDKSKLLDDFKITNENAPKRILDSNGDPITGARTNIRGRYALHLHRTGVNGNDKPAVLVGNSVVGSPGWGIVQHDSYAVLENNVAYDVFGAGFVSETGNEIGAWRNNISINNEGRSGNEKGGAYNHDLGFGGHGFWSQGRLVEIEGNVAAGNTGSGIFYFHRGVDEIKPVTENLAIEAWAKGQDEVLTSDPPIMGFQNNEVFASGDGLFVIKNSQIQKHDGRTVLDGFKAWEVVQGTRLEYTAHYTLSNFDVIGTKTSVHKNAENNGIHLFHNVEEIVFDGLKSEGFDKGVKLNKGTEVGTPLNDWGYIFIDANVKNNKEDWFNLDRNVDKFLSRSDINHGKLSFAVDNGKSDFAAKNGDQQLLTAAAVVGTKTDSLGSIALPFGNESLGYPLHQLRSLANKQGYYTLPDGQRAIIIDEYISDRLTGDTRKYSFVVTLENPNWTQDAKHLGSLNPNQLPQDNKIISLESLSADYPEFVQQNIQPESPLPTNPNPPVEEPVVEEPVVEEPVVEEPVIDAPIMEDPVEEDPQPPINEPGDAPEPIAPPIVIDTPTPVMSNEGIIRVEAELYNIDNFSDVNTANRGGAGDDLRRPLAVDVAENGGDDGLNVGWISPGEYLTYTIEVSEAGEYDMSASIASNVQGNHSLQVSVDGQTTETSFGYTGGWQTWESTSGDSVLDLSAGTHTLRVDMLTGGFNLDYVELDYAGATTENPVVVPEPEPEPAPAPEPAPTPEQPTAPAPAEPAEPSADVETPVEDISGGDITISDFLTGSNGNDKIVGSEANEHFDLGTASSYDIAVGGGGDDIFVLNQGSGYLIIRDFQVGNDQLELNNGLTFGSIEQTQRNGKTFLAAEGDTLAELTSFTGTLTASDFIEAS